MSRPPFVFADAFAIASRTVASSASINDARAPSASDLLMGWNPPVRPGDVVGRGRVIAVLLAPAEQARQSATEPLGHAPRRGDVVYSRSMNPRNRCSISTR